MNGNARQLLLSVLMIASAASATYLMPTKLLSSERKTVDLETHVPQQFGKWQIVPQTQAQIINPQQNELAKKLYSKILSRTYVSSSGEYVMLSIAYGANQTNGYSLHYPEVCYPAQGFELTSSQDVLMDGPAGPIKAKQMIARLSGRVEPLTYWTTIGNHVVRGAIETRMENLKYGFNGKIPDGLIFRVSSISKDQDKAYQTQKQFVAELTAALDPEMRELIVGIDDTAGKAGQQ